MVIREHHVLGETEPCLECQREENAKKVMELGTQLIDARAFRLNPNMITKTQAIQAGTYPSGHIVRKSMKSTRHRRSPAVNGMQMSWPSSD